MSALLLNMRRWLPAFLLAVTLSACVEVNQRVQYEEPIAKPSTKTGATAIFAGGCFWCVEQDFERIDGVLEAESGYTGGHTENPTYYKVGAGGTGHVEAVRVIYDPKKVNYSQLVEYFWRHIDPTEKYGQFCDYGPEYRGVIFVQNEIERKIAEDSRAALAASGRFKKIETEILPSSTFWMAEEYHQDYYKMNPLRYQYYRAACGRDQQIARLWGEK